MGRISGEVFIIVLAVRISCGMNKTGKIGGVWMPVCVTR